MLTCLRTPATLETPAKIAAAVRSALAVCLPVGSPIAHLSLYLDELRSSGEWNEEEIFQVDTRVRRFLAMLADADESGA